MINSEEYLREAFFQEYLTRSKYLAYANQAENEGYPEIAKLYGPRLKEIRCIY